jgi:pimeloyl-ACP methyl ester carboxylesterase
MPAINVNDVHLHYERIGSGEPLVLVHGSWVDHASWNALVPALFERFDVVAYDRRGHSDSEQPASQGSAAEDADDLAALIEALELAPANLLTNSFGGLIALRVAASRPELLRRISLHEPPALPLLASDPESAALLAPVGSSIAAVIAKLASGDHEAAAKQFVDEVAFGPGAWDNEVPEEIRATFIRNAPTFLDEASDPGGLDVDLEAISSFGKPVLLTDGDQSPPFFSKIVDKLAQAMPNAERRSIPAAGHVPQLTHPELYADIVSEFLLET